MHLPHIVLRRRHHWIGLFGWLATVAVGTGLPAAEASARPPINQDALLQHIRFLADDALEGRESGSEGNRRAVAYVADQFRQYGLHGAGPAGEFQQPFEIGLNPEFGTGCRLLVIRGRQTNSVPLGEGYLPFDHLDSGAAAGPLVFAGYGITAPESEYDDYAGLDVTNKIVLLLRKAPRDGRTNALFRGTSGRPSEHALFTTKLINARRHGAVAVLVVDATPARQTLEQLGGGGPFRMSPEKDALPMAFVSHETASNWLAAAGQDLAGVVRRIDETERPESFPLAGTRIDLHVAIKRERVTVHNVIGLLEGGDAKLKSEHLVVGAHLDHIGYGLDRRNRGRTNFIHNGADDNASGTAALLELARAFATAKERPARSLLFMGFNAEERGLLGSRHYVEHPWTPLSNTVAMINLDMIGRGASGLDVGGVGTSPGFKAMVERLGTNFTLKLKTTPGGKAPSDNTSFYNKNLPVLFFYTGRHDDYHKPTDDWQKVDRVEIESVARLAAMVVGELANAPGRPPFTKSDGNPVVRGRPRVLLGVVMNPAFAGPGVEVQEVAAGSAAARAGILKGDVLLQLGESEIRGVTDVTRFLGAQRPGGRTEAVVRRDGGQITLPVVF